MNKNDFLKDNFWLVETPIAHRGCHNLENPENSIGAFKEAIERKLPIELDIHLTCDNTIVVFHDYFTYRITGKSAIITALKHSDLNKYFLMGTKYTIPTLKEALEVINGQVPILIDIKESFSGKKIEEELIKIMANYHGNYAVCSFNTFTLKKIRKIDSNIIRIQNIITFKEVFFLEKLFLKYIVFKFFSKPSVISFSINYLPEKFLLELRRKYPLLGWLIDNNKELELSKKYFDNIIFQNIDWTLFKENKEF